jgi:hypothetical protein
VLSDTDLPREVARRRRAKGNFDIDAIEELAALLCRTDRAASGRLSRIAPSALAAVPPQSDPALVVGEPKFATNPAWPAVAP